MRLTETARGVRWLLNFRDADKATSADLLDAVQVVDAHYIRSGFVSSLQRAVGTAITPPCLLIPVQAREDLEGLLNSERARLAWEADRVSVYTHFSPGETPSVIGGS